MRVEEALTALNRALAFTPSSAAGLRCEIFVGLMTAKRRRGDYNGALADGLLAYDERVTQQTVLGVPPSAARLARLPLIRSILACCEFASHTETSEFALREAALRQELDDADTFRRLRALSLDALDIGTE